MNSIKWPGGVHPLTPFVRWRMRAPYSPHVFDAPEALAHEVQIVPVESETGLARADHGSARLVHLVHSMAVARFAGRQQLAARWLCNAGGSEKAIEVAASESNQLCPACEDRGRGPAVYRLFAGDGGLLYVGASKEASARLRAHERKEAWWKDVTDIRTERFATIVEALDAETKAIKAEGPLHNKMHAIGYRRPS